MMSEFTPILRRAVMRHLPNLELRRQDSPRRPEIAR
jgi:hypothetical protein